MTVAVPEMQLTSINGVDLDLFDSGGMGEPVVFIHGGMRDECFAVLQEPALSDRFRLIHYHRRGWGRSEATGLPLTMSGQAADTRAVLDHLDIERAHFVGHSNGGTILLQVVKEHPEIVHSLALVEPRIPQVLENYTEHEVGVKQAAEQFQAGDPAKAIDTFAGEICGPDYRSRFDRWLPDGWFERWVEDAGNIFWYTPQLADRAFVEEDAAGVTKPVLNILGADSRPGFHAVYKTVQTWFPETESVVVPDAVHGPLSSNPRDCAGHMTDFFARHPIAELRIR
jgi:pimeloyl-ACP methyl ester carboxylesterase